MIKIKICGMRDPANVRAVAELGPDYMGFIFYDKSPRFAGASVFEFRVPGLRTVGVFVNESTEKIIEKGFDIIQLHGDEKPSQVDDLKKHGIKVIKAFSVDDDFDFMKTKDYNADYFLFDTKGKFYGGNAKAFNWKKLEEYDQSKPFFLSGGLNEENTKDLTVLKGMNLYALDLNSGVEDSPGLKNIEKIKGIMSCLK